MTTTNTILTPGGAAGAAGVDFETTREIGYYRLVWRRFCSRRVALVSAVVLAALTLACYAGPFLLPAEKVDLTIPNVSPFTTIHHILGTDDVGRDLLLRNLTGGRISLLVGASAMVLTISIATVLGALSGFFGGVVDTVVTGLTNAVLSIPSILILVIFAKAFGQSVLTIVVGIAIIGWPSTARIVRSVILSIREKEFVEAARAVGTPRMRIMTRHLIPNALGPIVVSASLTIGAAILLESALSFLGLGINPPTSTWGSLLNEGRDKLSSPSGIFYSLWPGFMILITVLSFNYIGDALRDAFDPTVPGAMNDSEPLLSIEGLRTHFFTNDGVVRAVDGISLEVRQGETLGLVGESGCGKSITALSVMRLLSRPGRAVAGRVHFAGRNLLELPEEEMEDVRGNDIAMIFQEPMTSLNPVFRVGDQIGEALGRHLGIGRDEARDRVVELFTTVGIPSPERRVREYPHQLSGGMRQRVMIAMALACKPRLLIADEPTTALDVTIQAQILELIKELKRTQNMAVVMITHDLGVIAEVALNVAVMYAGKIVERAPVEELFAAPQHPYTQGLLGSIPSPDKLGRRLDVIRGVVPHPLNLPPGCTFAPRCPQRMDICDSAFPALEATGPAHHVACYLYTTRQDEVRSDGPMRVDPSSPLADEVLPAQDSIPGLSA